MARLAVLLCLGAWAAYLLLCWLVRPRRKPPER